MHLLIWMWIKEDNTPCISFTEASVDLQHSEIICLTDASVKWTQRRNEDCIVPKRAICMKEDDEKKYIIAYPGSRLLEAKISMCLLKSNACTIILHYPLPSLCVQRTILSDRIA
jgi:hypothetical protein